VSGEWEMGIRGWGMGHRKRIRGRAKE